MKVGEIVKIIAEDYGSSGEGIAHIDSSGAAQKIEKGDTYRSISSADTKNNSSNSSNNSKAQVSNAPSDIRLSNAQKYDKKQNEGSYTVFATGVIKGEKAEVRINHINPKKNLIFAKAYKLLEVSPFRVTPRCPVHSACGGCNMQHIAYGEQLNIKKAQIINCLAKYAKIELNNLEVEPSPQYGYRNKLQLPVREEKGIIKIGFFREGTHEVMPINHCPLHGDWAEKLVRCVKSYMVENKISAYNEITNTGLIRHIVARHFGKTLSVILVVNGNKLPLFNTLIKKLEEAFAANFTLSLSENIAKTNLVITSEKLTTLYGKEEICESYNGLSVRFSPLAFLQINDVISYKIYRQAEVLASEGNDIIDAYSGAGIMTAILSKKARNIIGIEINAHASIAADRLAEDNNISNMTNLCGDVAALLPLLIMSVGDNANANENDGKTTDNASIKILGDDVSATKCGALVENAQNQSEMPNLVIGQANTQSRGLTSLLGASNRATEQSNADIVGQNATSTAKKGDSSGIDDDGTSFASEDSALLAEISISNAKKIAPFANTLLPEKLTVILDPPRKGCDIAVTEILATIRPSQIIYISCNPSTLARDLAVINRDNAYTLTYVKGYDMFPNTAHVETLVCLTRKN